MKKFKLLILIGLLSGCGPVYQTDYQMVPPQSETGRQCANNCLLSKQNCEQTCQIQEMSCEERGRLQSRNEYLEYVAVQHAAGQPVTRREHEFQQYYNCSSNYCVASCGENYRMCHTNCGGQVVPHTYCTAFCDKQ
jgi:hypothetical protein